MPGCRAGRAQPHPGCVMTGAPRPGSQIRVEKGLLGDSDKLPLPAFQGTGLTQDHAVGTPHASSSPYALSNAFNGFKAFKLSLILGGILG